ncbi:MAG: Ldh family oxidoreductase [Bryobacterales bacterium]|nr:Ldh family oxidoreductase [Bryobacterales bacterium]
MSWYPGTEREQRVNAGSLRVFTADLFERCGMTGVDAALVADSLVSSDERGVHSHGVLRVPEYVAKLRTGGVDPAGRPEPVRENGAALVVDGGNAMGQVAAMFAMRAAIERASALGVAFAAVRGSNHCGAMFYYAMEALGHDMVGLCATSALPTMAPWGGTEKLVGINPLAVAIPTRDEAAVVLDAAFSYSSHGKIRVFQQKGEPIPATWAFDANGEPTTDAAQALTGLLQPIGEFKGVGLAVVFGMLSTLLSGASYGTRLGNMTDGPKAGADGHFFLALNIAAFTDLLRFREAADEVVREIRSSRRRAGADPLYAPGGMEAATQVRYKAEGIPLNGATMEGLRFAAHLLGADAGFLNP